MLAKITCYVGNRNCSRFKSLLGEFFDLPHHKLKTQVAIVETQVAIEQMQPAFVGTQALSKESNSSNREYRQF